MLDLAMHPDGSVFAVLKPVGRLYGWSPESQEVEAVPGYFEDWLPLISMTKVSSTPVPKIPTLGH